MKKIFFLHNLIRMALKEEGSPYALARAIEKANANAAEKGAISRQALQRMEKAPQRRTYSYSQLVALDNYFSTLGCGLDRNPIFQKPGILDGVVETARVAFLLGSIPRASEQRNDLSRWDTRSVALLLHEIYQRSAELLLDRRRIEFEIEDVLLDFPVRLDRLTSQPWHRFLREHQYSVISIGSPRACHASEVILADMFGVKPFHETGQAGVRLPFSFIWPQHESLAKTGNTSRRLKRNPLGFESAFAWQADAIKNENPALAAKIRQGKASAFWHNGTIYPVEPHKAGFTMYAVIAAQRRRNSQLHVVVAGISGPATHAAAALIPEFEGVLPHTPGKDSPVVYVPIEVRITLDHSSGRRGDIRKVDGAEWLAQPQIWDKPEASPGKKEGQNERLKT